METVNYLKTWGVVCLCVWLGSVASADDPNEFNPIGSSFITSGSLEGREPCGWKEALSWNGWDGGQLTIKINTCLVFYYWIESFPQNAMGAAELEKNDLIVVWDEDAGHGSDESQKNFSFTGTIGKIEASAYEDYLELSTTDQRTNWAVYQAQTDGTFTKGAAGTNEHEIIHLSGGYNIMEFWKEDGDPGCVAENDEIVYQICFDNLYGDILEEAFVVDWLPDGVDYPEGEYRTGL
jgi:hypothetical protein